MKHSFLLTLLIMVVIVNLFAFNIVYFKSAWFMNDFKSTELNLLKFELGHKSPFRSFRKEDYAAFFNNYNITKIIHHSWRSKEVPSIFRRYVKSWKECFPHWEHRYWQDEDNRFLISKHYSWFLIKYDSFPRSIYRADCARYAYMHRYGGVYTDMDNECLNPFEHLLANYSMVFSYTFNVNGYIQNSFMYSKPNHPLWLELLTNINKSNISRGPDVQTGPSVLTFVIIKYLKKFQKSHNIKVYDSRYFNPITWSEQSLNPWYCKIYNQMTDEQYQLCREHHLKVGTYVVQYHTHVWG